MANIIIGKKDREAIIKFLENEYKQLQRGARGAAAPSTLSQKQRASKPAPTAHRKVKSGK